MTQNIMPRIHNDFFFSLVPSVMHWALVTSFTSVQNILCWWSKLHTLLVVQAAYFAGGPSCILYLSLWFCGIMFCVTMICHNNFVTLCFRMLSRMPLNWPGESLWFCVIMILCHCDFEPGSPAGQNKNPDYQMYCYINKKDNKKCTEITNIKSQIHHKKLWISIKLKTPVK